MTVTKPMSRRSNGLASAEDRITEQGRRLHTAQPTGRAAGSRWGVGNTLRNGRRPRCCRAQPIASRDSVAGCIGLALGLIDHWLAGHDTSAPPGLAGLTRLPAGHWTGERAARDILTLARKG